MIKILTFIIFSRFSNNVDDVDFGISFEFWFQTFCSSHSVRYLERGGTKRKKNPYRFVWTHNMLCQGALGANLDGKFNVVKLSWNLQELGLCTWDFGQLAYQLNAWQLHERRMKSSQTSNFIYQQWFHTNANTSDHSIKLLLMKDRLQDLVFCVYVSYSCKFRKTEIWV